jgi:hypothetical protein
MIAELLHRLILAAWALAEAYTLAWLIQAIWSAALLPMQAVIGAR